MKKAIIFLLYFYSCVGFAESQQSRSDYSTEESQAKVNKILHTTSLYMKDLRYSEPVAEIFSRFLGTTYQAHTLIGSSSRQERLVTDPSTVDCFTFIDYVRFMAHASNWQTYVSELVKTRYTDGMIDFTGRKYFSRTGLSHFREMHKILFRTSAHILLLSTNSQTKRIKNKNMSRVSALSHAG